MDNVARERAAAAAIAASSTTWSELHGSDGQTRSLTTSTQTIPGKKTFQIIENETEYNE